MAYDGCRLPDWLIASNRLSSGGVGVVGVGGNAGGDETVGAVRVFKAIRDAIAFNLSARIHFPFVAVEFWSSLASDTLPSFAN